MASPSLPTRRTSESGLDQFNQQLRANPAYQQFLRSIGVNTNVPAGQAWRLSDQQRKQAEAWVKRNVGDIGDLEIDISGNANANEGLGKQAKRWGPIVGGTAATLFGIPGLFPGLLNAGGSAAAGGASAAASGGGGVLPSAAIPGMHAAVPAAIASQGVSAGLGGIGTAAGLGAGASVPLGEMTAGGTAAGVGSRLASGAKDFLGDLASPEGAATLAALIAGLKSQSSGQQNAEEVQRIQAITEARMRRADPLHQVAVNLAFGRMPTNYRQGVQLNNVPLPE
jgi:hypothetical protein